MVLRQGDAGSETKILQRGLNKVGAMLLVDGEFGADTRAAIIDARVTLGRPGPAEADDDLQVALATSPDLFPPLTAAGVTFIARAEVASPSTYRQKYQAPCWPSPKSGITIGIGYDCQFVTEAQFRSDWTDTLSADTIDRLVPALGRVGSADLLAQVHQVTVPLGTGVMVFANRSLPKYLGQTRAIYPQVDHLEPACRTALVSLIYNRGNGLTDNGDHQDRLEMRTIRDLLAAGRLDGVAGQFEAMTRLWDPAKLGGLIQRRRAEATLWRSGFAAFQLD
jgi:hypothetical protein